MIRLDVKDNDRLEELLNLVNKDKELETLWKCANINAIDRMGFNDHGPVHIQIVCRNSLELLRILERKKIIPNVIKDHGLEQEDAEVIVVLASLLHDIGMVIRRKDHEEFSVPLSLKFIDKYLPQIYDSEETRTIIKSEVLHAIMGHSKEEEPLTIEAGIVRVADALDMEQGRARIPFEIGSVTIHSVSALAIERVQILEGEKKPILVKILMSNSAGIFQIDELLKEKIKSTPIEKLIRVVAEIQSEKEKSIVHNFEF
ncbi:MAG: HD domain-containing protein [Candidatus Aenigmarchaeota archaeon]|nr:HD domain-containing protein [Candidatus Aenigmarchaeota archaeon]OIN86719.1 MAG: phosphohydrolase [Candidatus Aenigmarchaeota archaeon CG1_02_38_14]PIV68617.1 MAG: phosphohydrolase [Candidatus Aenigmarchaeota archaeon CG01_land_8_20_14_3_00_37_9]PIW40765.1 MAG: phosphohydrolase [Candidatus Aenigmarchaeota archaeon CG15_BIG_FIL_POST_REV_8_21_14_020_37_27]PIX50749.1 MAG: phosphohydrolase [Candidatus Aenigmarchaeota archaeon CG_4_8_14_3_um_filter_37_24]PJB74610.1 MAG: phosphohydrolase [Candid